MPNNIDMGGFGSPGLPVMAGVLGAVGIDGTAASPSTLFDVRVNSTSQFHVTRNGTIRVRADSGGISNYASFGASSQNPTIYRGGTLQAMFDQGCTLASTGYYGIDDGVPGEGGSDVRLYRDAADTFAQRRTTSAQTFRVYGTWTDASNYVRASLAATSTAVTLAAETAGTGADNVPVILTPAGTSQVEVGNGVQFTEMTAPSAPAANKVILFAQDNGAGKTQLMALFPSGAAQQVSIEP